eukprot:TRINITY_DN53205_c0_g1_i1.p1 TRINITY_DN53205_c0_g1~~TRINITY_DN53205_c0_g1_i1.p1  ORF type:complete len:696 (+),score=137.44 TRINITY_DN53205_c0_g1_i1:57-2144(+)
MEVKAAVSHLHLGLIHLRSVLKATSSTVDDDRVALLEIASHIRELAALTLTPPGEWDRQDKELLSLPAAPPAPDAPEAPLAEVWDFGDSAEEQDAHRPPEIEVDTEIFMNGAGSAVQKTMSLCPPEEPFSPAQPPGDVDLADYKSQLIDLFTQLDTDQSGVISTDNLREVLRGIGLPPVWSRSLIKAADANDNGSIDLAEWMTAIDTMVEGNGSSMIESFARTLVSKRETLAILHADKVDRSLPYCMVSCTSRVRMAWDCCLCLLLLYIATIMPFLLAFGSAEDKEAESMIGLVLDCFFMLDVVFNFRTTYMESPAEEVSDGYKIACRYCRTWFCFDLISSIPLEYLSGGFLPSLQSLRIVKGGKAFKFLKLLRIAKTAKLLEASYLGELLDEVMMQSSYQTLLAIGRMLIYCFLLCHVLACFMQVSGTGFLESYVYHDPDNFSMYIAALYWAMTTMTTVGYGDITPTTDDERMYAMVAMVVGGAFYGYVVGNVSLIVANRDLNRQAFKDKMNLVNAWLEHRQFSQVLKRRIWLYYKAYLNNKTALDESNILNELSPELRQDVAAFLIHPQVRNYHLFDNLPVSAIVRLVPALQHITAEANERISTRGHLGSAMFIITEGTASIERGNPEERQTEILQEGDGFGEEIVLGLAKYYDYTITALSKVAMIMIPVELFMDQFGSMPEIISLMRTNYKM